MQSVAPRIAMMHPRLKMTAKTESREKSPRVTVTMSRRLLQRVDAYAESIDPDVPGSRGVAMRKLVLLGLQRVESKR